MGFWGGRQGKNYGKDRRNKTSSIAGSDDASIARQGKRTMSPEEGEKPKRRNEG